MESSSFDNINRKSSCADNSIEKVPTNHVGSTCDTFKMKLYGKLVFVKQLKKEFISNPRYISAFKKEFELGFGFDHPGLVRYLEYSNNNNLPYLIIEYVDGVTLSEFIELYPNYFSKKENYLNFLDELLSALEYLHSKQVLHLDLKPDNIMITRIGNNVKLIDFGCSYSDTFDDTTGNTPSFASPEQLKQDNSLNVESDIYSVGKIMQFIRTHTDKTPGYLTKIEKKAVEVKSDKRFASVKSLRDTIANKSNSKIRIIYTLIFSILLCVSFFVAIYIFIESQNKNTVQSEQLFEENKSKYPPDANNIDLNSEEISSENIGSPGLDNYASENKDNNLERESDNLNEIHNDYSNWRELNYADKSIAQQFKQDSLYISIYEAKHYRQTIPDFDIKRDSLIADINNSFRVNFSFFDNLTKQPYSITYDSLLLIQKSDSLNRVVRNYIGFLYKSKYDMLPTRVIKKELKRKREIHDAKIHKIIERRLEYQRINNTHEKEATSRF